ncbi:MAG: hypothetical protein M3Z04_07030 [Chloroflexota bacterium]|nr:hypothetical protein [Chloroflexota bacterium]
MTQLRGTLLSVGILIGLVFILSGRTWNQPTPGGPGGIPPVLTPPAVLAGFPDIAHIPIYPAATVTFTQTRKLGDNTIWITVPVRLDKVRVFYEEMLPQQGWQLQNSQDVYNWTDPTGTELSGMELEVGFTPNDDWSETTVSLNYRRYPNIAAGLPVYPGAQHVQVTHSTVEKSLLMKTRTAHITELTYLTAANPDTLATFYGTRLPTDGWQFREPGWSTNPVLRSQVASPGSWGTHSPPEGLYFTAVHVAQSTQLMEVYYNLLATTRPAPDGQTQVTVHVEEFETEVPGF